jgi:ribosomal protein L32
MRFCPDCGRERIEGFFCGDCGYRFPVNAQVSCLKCGAERREGLFCADCGNRFAEAEHSAMGDIGTLSVRVSSTAQENKEVNKRHEEELKQILSSLKYGRGFSRLEHCSNCGEPKANSKKSCNLCGSSLE